MNTIEQQLFSWENCQAADPEQLQFSDVTLKVPIGEFKVGEKFDHATLLWEFSKLQLTRFGEGGRSERWDYELLLGAGQLLTRVSDPFGNPNQPKKIGAKVEETLEFDSLEDEEESNEWGEHTRREV